MALRISHRSSCNSAPIAFWLSKQRKEPGPRRPRKDTHHMCLPRFGALFLEEQHGGLLYMFDPRENLGKKCCLHQHCSSLRLQGFFCVCVSIINKPTHFFVGVVVCFQLQRGRSTCGYDMSSTPWQVPCGLDNRVQHVLLTGDS